MRTLGHTLYSSVLYQKQPLETYCVQSAEVEYYFSVIKRDKNANILISRLLRLEFIFPDILTLRLYCGGAQAADEYNVRVAGRFIAWALICYGWGTMGWVAKGFDGTVVTNE